VLSGGAKMMSRSPSTMKKLGTRSSMLINVLGVRVWIHPVFCFAIRFDSIRFDSIRFDSIRFDSSVLKPAACQVKKLF